MNHLLRTVPRDWLAAQLRNFDAGVRGALTEILKTSISDSASSQVRLPFRLGGYRSQRCLGNSSAAFVISVERTLALTGPSSMLSNQHLDAEFVRVRDSRDILLAD